MFVPNWVKDVTTDQILQMSIGSQLYPPNDSAGIDAWLILANSAVYGDYVPDGQAELQHYADVAIVEINNRANAARGTYSETGGGRVKKPSPGATRRAPAKGRYAGIG